MMGERTANEKKIKEIFEIGFKRKYILQGTEKSVDSKISS